MKKQSSNEDLEMNLTNSKTRITDLKKQLKENEELNDDYLTKIKDLEANLKFNEKANILETEKLKTKVSQLNAQFLVIAT